ncbi:MAG: hypothetical protein ACREJC_18585 [Tepidisphaeraceae bacterium]
MQEILCVVCVLCVLCGELLVTGCAAKPKATTPATGPVALDPDKEVRARCVPPVGWTALAPRTVGLGREVVWLSPTGRTAYGVIHFTMPLPVGHEMALWGFLDQMKKNEGGATLVSKQWDEQLRGMRFVADSGVHYVRTNLVVRGFSGWAVYAGTLSRGPVEPGELELAEHAREATIMGLGD